MEVKYCLVVLNMLKKKAYIGKNPAAAPLHRNNDQVTQKENLDVSSFMRKLPNYSSQLHESVSLSRRGCDRVTAFKHSWLPLSDQL